MRLWSLDPALLDSRGLVALWREALLAQKVLRGRTRGYRHHPQLDRFKRLDDPLKGMGRYLMGVWTAAEKRGYHFGASKVLQPQAGGRRLPVKRGQLRYEWRHLRAKLRKRNPAWLKSLGRVELRPHPLFRLVEGPVEVWERQKANA